VGVHRRAKGALRLVAGHQRVIGLGYGKDLARRGGTQVHRLGLHDIDHPFVQELGELPQLRKGLAQHHGIPQRPLHLDGAPQVIGAHGRLDPKGVVGL